MLNILHLQFIVYQFYCSVKQEYIKLKHQQCLYAFRESYEDGFLSVENELGKQLHASVRTPNLETSFRLLALGADPNYFHDVSNLGVYLKLFFIYYIS